MPAFSAAEIERLARLARIRLEDDEVERLRSELGAILEDLEILHRLASVHPAGDPGATAPLRDDLPSADPFLLPPDAFAPAWSEGYFVAPNPPGLGG